MTKIKEKKNRNLFEYEERMKELTRKKTHLERLNQIIPWEIFRAPLENAFHKEAKAPGGASHYDYVFMFKVLVIQKFYSLSDEQTEYQIKDRLSFQKFLGLTLSDDIPDEKTIWHFRECLIKEGAIDELFQLFNAHLHKQGVVGNEGIIIDASFVEMPRQRNNRDDNKKIKSGEVPEDWKENEHKMRQKDIDARWTKKNNETYYGYKDHVKADKDSKIILSYHTTPANVHDSQALGDLLTDDDRGKDAWADSAYADQPILNEYEMSLHVHEKGCRNRKLTDEQKQLNREKSRVRARVEHIFGFIENSMKGFTVRSIGLPRAHGNIGLINLVYNMCRYWQCVNV
jgi:IS5 family transposase